MLSVLFVSQRDTPMKMFFFALAFCLFTITASAQARQDDTPPVITAETVRDLRPARVSGWTWPTPIELAPPIPSGWFNLSPDGRTLIAGRGAAGATFWDVASGLYLRAYGLNLEADPLAPPNLIDARFSPDSQSVVALHGAPLPGWAYGVFVTEVTTGQQISLPIPTTYGYPFRVWFDAEQPERYVWLEFQPDLFDPSLGAHQIGKFDLISQSLPPDILVPSGPENDPDSIVRIGRIPAPLAITATAEGVVKLWDLQTNTVTAQVKLPVAPTFGRVNETEGVHFVWRDSTSDGLHLLDFETGEDEFITQLGGDYIQAFMITPTADVILAVHRGDTPTVSAWIVATGEQIDLGTYWDACTRVPDMVAFSDDGTRVVIGCDAGFEVWEVATN